MSRAAGQATVFVWWGSSWAQQHQLDTVFSSGCGGSSECCSHPNTSCCAFHQPLGHVTSPLHPYLPLMLGDELRRMSDPSSGSLSYSLHVSLKLHVLCDSSLEETFLWHQFFFLIEKYTYCKVHVEVGTHVSTIQVKKQDLVTPPPLFKTA